MTRPRRNPAALLALLLCTAGTAQSQQALQYLDDRSTPEKLVQSFYNAINDKDYVRAYSYFSPGWAPEDFQSWAKGYADTKAVSVQFGSTAPDLGAGQIHWALPVAVSALSTEGKTTVFSGCYEIHFLNGPQSAPPFQPMSINKGDLTPSDKPIQDAIPSSC